MKNFFKGAIFVSLLYPIAEGLISLYNQAIDFFCTKIAEQTYIIRKRIQEEEENPPSDVQAIGFHIPSSNELKDEEEDDIC